MLLEYVENIVQLMACLIALLFCLFQYISGKQKGWVYATAVFLCSLMSSYYWTAYLVIMGDYPNVSNLFSYMGWNVAFVFLLILVLHMRCAESRRFFHPLMLLPIPLNVWQLTLYLQYGGVLNNLFQVSVTTAVACFSLQGILWYRRNRKHGAVRPYVAMVALLYVFFEYGMWTTSCFAAPIGTLYYPLSFLASMVLLGLTWALSLTYRPERSPARDGMIRRHQAILKAVYFAVVLVCSVGGIMLGIWMRDTMRAGLQQASESNLYSIIHVVLFVISLFLVAFAAAIIYVVRFSEKVAENNELSEARQIAEHSNAAKSEFLANMSHEIRTPINAVLGMNEIILRESRQALDRLPEPREAVQGVFADICNYAVNIRSAGNNLLSIINDILDFSKIEAGKLVIAEAPYRMSSVLNDVSNMIAFKARDKGLDFRVNVDDALPDCLYGDEVRVRQIVTNVLNNAVKYTREGSVSLTVCGARGDAAQAGGAIDLKIVVEDTGVGIRPEDIGRLFEKFERADLRHNSTVEGTGLGLAITRNLLDMMGGSIDVQSVYGEGSVFTIVLPQKAVGTEPIGNFRERFMQPQKETAVYRESFHAPEARILVVDDTRMNLTVVVNLLKKTGIRIDAVDSGEEAVRLSRSQRYDLILMDQRMPGMDGTEAMRRIREQSDGVNRETPFICLTADAVSGARERYLAEGFTDYLTKPIDSRALEQALMKYLPSAKVQVEEADRPVERQDEDGLREDPLEALRAAGVDTEVGVRYSGDDPEMYRALLREYAGGAQERARALREYRDAGDWKNYAILAHALKSNSRMIGAAALSETAGRLEAAADAGQTEVIRQAHDDMIARYTALAGIIEGSLGPQSHSAADDEILEFLPEGNDDMKVRAREKGRLNLFVPMIVIFCLMVVMVLYTSRVIQNVATGNVHEVGEDRISGVAAQLENYLERTKSALWVSADTVDYMIRNGASTQYILDYIMEETDRQRTHYDVNITGLYGYIQGEYLDGLAWVPPEGYDPTRRDWYKIALDAQGEITIVPPYVDAQTNDIVISICRMLSNGADVISIDLTMNHIQEIVADLHIMEKGYGFVVNRDGMIIAHRDAEQKGRNLTEDAEQRALLEAVLEKQNGIFEMTMGGEKQTVFVREIVDQWYVVIAVGNRELFAEVWQQMAVNVLICIVIFALIAFFYLIGHRNEQNYSRRIEEMRAEEQKQAYEARALKLEKEAADRSNQAKSSFLAEMSHEIRTPINAVLGMNEMILRESTRARGEEAAVPAVRDAFAGITACARNIKSAGNNLLAIINDILDLSKIEAGKMDIVEGGYQLSSMLNDLSNMIFFKAREKGLDFTIDVDEVLPDGLFGDEVRVRQILTNILNNAVKYTEQGFVRLTLRGDMPDTAAAAVGQTIRLVITVQDTGVGIRPEDIDKLFDKFQRLDLEQNSTVEGTGLGLAITHRLLDMMGGSIEVKSEYGKGSVFTVTLPQKIVSLEPVGDFRKRFRLHLLASADYHETFRAPEARVLIVDDTRMNLTVAVGLLRDTRIQIDTATGGEEAITLAATRPYDLILMDQRMPRMDGTEALRRIRAQADGANHNTPVICLTADAVIGAKERYIADGFTDYLTKPIDSQALEQMLMAYLPEEKVVPMRKTDSPAKRAAEPSDPSGQDAYAPLREAGVEPEVGLNYCQMDDALYRSLLTEYARSAEEKERGIVKSYEEQDWKDYATAVHAVKSTSRTIGAVALSNIAADLERDADAGDRVAVEGNHRRLIDRYEAVVAAIRSMGPPANELPEDEDIIEFPPE